MLKDAANSKSFDEIPCFDRLREFSLQKHGMYLS
jgi:hypothetical protein